MKAIQLQARAARAVRRLASSLLVCAAGAVGAGEAAPADWSAAAELGQALYQGTRAFAQAPSVAGAPLPRAEGACGRCHGALGEGGREANIAAPAIAAFASAPGSALVDALLRGIGTHGRLLGPSMPRYALADDERVALQAFLPWLGRADLPVRGVSEGELRLGLALDGLGSGAARTQVEAGVRSVLQAVNEAGGVHGRQLRLLAVTDGTAPVFALVGSAPAAALRERLAAERLPNLASLALETDDAATTDWVVPLLPSLRQQARVALQALAAAPPGCTPWLVDPSGWLTAAESGAVARWPARPRGGTKALCVVALAPADEVDRLRADWEAQGIPWRMLVELAWLRPRPIVREGLDHQIVLPAPQAVAERAVGQGSSLWFELGAASARVTVEALARSGRVLRPERALAQLRGLAGFEPVATAPLAFSRQQTHGWAPQRWSAVPAPSLHAQGATP